MPGQHSSDQANWRCNGKEISHFSAKFSVPACLKRVQGVSTICGLFGPRGGGGSDSLLATHVDIYAPYSLHMHTSPLEKQFEWFM